jgi:carnitine O-octanoyltransferase
MESTFQSDELLPPLPIPSLEDSCRKYLKSVQPHVSPEELRKTTFIVNMFVTGEGKRLQEQLKERGKQMKNWLEEWWEAAAYLSVRTPLAVLSNYGGPSWLESKWPPLMGSRCERAALWICGGLGFYQLLRSEKVPPQVHAGRCLSMNEFRRLFACTRMPFPSMDRLHTHFKTMSEGPSPNHVIVTCNGHIYCLYVIHEDQTVLSLSELKQQLSWIETHSQLIGKGPGVCALTSTNRDIWAKV